MIEAAFVGALFALGIIILLRGMFPSQQTLHERISALATFEGADRFLEEDEESLEVVRKRTAVRVLELVKNDGLEDVRSDIAAAQMSFEAFAIDKLNAAVGVGVLFAALAAWANLVSGLSALIVVAMIGAVIGYWIPDLEMRKKAAAGRLEFEKALNAFVGLVSVSMTGGGGLNTAMSDAATVGRGWVFEAIQSTLDAAALKGENSWTALDRLGRKYQVPALIELAGALALAGNSGARITETLLARAESGRKKEISDARAEAEKTSVNLGVPVGSLVVGWIGFLGYPAVSGLIEGLTQ